MTIEANTNKGKSKTSQTKKDRSPDSRWVVVELNISICILKLVLEIFVLKRVIVVFKEEVEPYGVR